MNKYVEKYIEDQIIKQIKEEKMEENLEFKFALSGIGSLIYNYNGIAYLSCFNDEKGIYFDAEVKWIEKDNEVKFDIKYKYLSKKEDLGIYNWL